MWRTLTLLWDQDIYLPNCGAIHSLLKQVKTQKINLDLSVYCSVLDSLIIGKKTHDAFFFFFLFLMRLLQLLTWMDTHHVIRFWLPLLMMGILRMPWRCSMKCLLNVFLPLQASDFWQSNTCSGKSPCRSKQDAPEVCRFGRLFF